MGALNIRNVSEELIKRLKANAAMNGQTLREYVLMQLGGGEPRRAGLDESSADRVRLGKVQRTDHLSAEMPTPPAKSVRECANCEHVRHRHRDGTGVCQEDRCYCSRFQ